MWLPLFINIIDASLFTGRFIVPNRNLGYYEMSVTFKGSRQKNILTTKTYIFLLDKGFPPLTDMSAKNIGYFERLPLGSFYDWLDLPEYRYKE